MKISYKLIVFLILAMLASFCITCDFAIIKPASSSIFISKYGASNIPYAWLAVIPLNLFIVNGYNWLLPRFGCVRLFLGTTLFVAGMNLFTGFFAGSYAWLPFVQYVLKDIYVLLMFQQIWSVIHVTIKMNEAKYLYGLIFGVGGLGAVLGSYITKSFAVGLGSEHLLFATIPIYTSFIAIYLLLVKVSQWNTGANELTVLQKEKKEDRGGFKKIYASRYLQYILCIVVSMQLTATVVEYQFNMYLESAFPVQDVRTSFTGMLFGYVNLATVLFQFVGSTIFIHFLGVLRSHVLIPCGLSILAGCNILLPSFSMVAATFGSIKSLDYSIFRILTEMLYIPLSTEEKFSAKAVIDVFAYRTARGIASILVIGLQGIAPLFIDSTLKMGAFVVLLVWIIATFGIARESQRFQEKPA